MNTSSCTAAAAWRWGAARIARFDARLLLEKITGLSHAALLAHGDDYELSAEQQQTWRQAVERCAGGEPLPYVIGECEFFGRTFAVSPAVLIPRPETEELLRWALQVGDEAALGMERPVLDLGCGSGILAIHLALAWSTVPVWGGDISSEALALAQANARRHGASVHFCLGSWWQAVGERQFALVVSNPPYIAPHDPHLAALQHEPQTALVAAEQGLADLRAIIDHAMPHLLDGAWLLLEHGHDQGAACRRLLAAAGFVEISTRRDLAGLDRVTGGRRVG